MVGEGVDIVAVGARYNLDPRLLVALSGAESRFGLDTKAKYNVMGLFLHGKHASLSSYYQCFQIAASSVVNPQNHYDLTSCVTLYSTYCHGVCTNGQHLLKTFMFEQGAALDSVRFPKDEAKR